MTDAERAAELDRRRARSERVAELTARYPNIPWWVISTVASMTHEQLVEFNDALQIELRRLGLSSTTDEGATE